MNPTYLNIKKTELERIYISDKVILYQDYYTTITPSNLAQIFTRLHCAFNDLFGFMNSKSEYGGHYNAHESRKLLDIIDYFEILKANLKESDSNFNLDEYYTDTINYCKKFLKRNSGSTIPDDFIDINLIDNKPIFKLNSTISLITQNKIIHSNLKVIGQGSYAHVSSYIDPNLGIEVALKKAKKNLTPTELTRFKNEFKDLKSLDSPFIVKVYTYDDDNNSYTMEYVNETLDSFISKENTKITFYDRRALIVQLFKAFKFFHSKNLLHRDISYSNILINTYEDSSQIIKVADLGLVKRENSDLTRHDTQVKGAINDYSDLERVGFDNYEIRHETFALTKVVYFILTGRKNYHNETNVYLKDFLAKGLSLDKEQRFKSVEELESYLKNFVYLHLK